MSDLMQPTAPESPKDAKARAKAEKAYSKAVRPWYKKPLIVAPLAIVVLLVGQSLSGGGDAPVADSQSVQAPADDTQAETDEQAAEADTAEEGAADAADAEAGDESPVEEAHRLGDPAQDGKFTFVVKSFECGKTKLGSQYLEEKAQGQFCLMDVTVENHGDEPQMLFSDNQVVFDAKGRQFAHDDMAAMMIDGNDSVWIEEINPGNSVRGTMVFDVPKNAKIVAAQLHDSAFSNGVRISLK
ncbi:MAG TPA: DUF4352 domain-containing protein [Egibacteraceae bacterium]|nr:DUF4352 domain-containing protein [Egibacteraceae bacterium]